MRTKRFLVDNLEYAIMHRSAASWRMRRIMLDVSAVAMKVKHC
jgi:hypothetical protein